MLDPGVVLRIDAGAWHSAASMAISGAAAVARQAVSGLTTALRVNGATGVVITRRGRPVTVMGFTVAEGKIVEIDAIADPERVPRIAAAVLHDE